MAILKLKFGCALIAMMSVFIAPAPSAVAQDDEEIDWFSTDFMPLWRFRGEYLAWWSNGNRLPPLVTTSPAGTLRPDAGVLGTSGVQTLFGDSTIATGARSGGRLTVTRWFEELEDTALEFVGFYVGDDYQSGDFVAASQGSPILARPFLNAETGLEDAELVAFPNVLAGRVEVASYSEIYSAAALVRHNIAIGPAGRIDFLGGYRYFRLRETLTIRENLTSTNTGGLIQQGTTTDLLDQFNAGNDFHGGEFGLAAEFFWYDFSIELLAKVAIGGIFRNSDISGRTITTVPGDPPDLAAGGLFALPTNIGARSDGRFGVLPELGVNTRLPLMPGTSLVFGYSLIVVSDVLRTGDQIDRVVNVSQIGGGTLTSPPRPAFAFRDSNFVIQGLNVGLDYCW